MTVLAAWLVVGAILLFGLTLHRTLVLWLNRGVHPPVRDGTDLLLSGILPGLALVGGLATALGAVHLLRTEVVLFLAAIFMIWRRNDVLEIFIDLRNLAVMGGRATAKGNPFPLLAAAAFVGLAMVMSVTALFPAATADVWAFQIPLAQSIVSHGGFVTPQIDSNFYGNIPLFFNVLFACSLLFVDHWLGPGLLNAAIYLGFLLLLTSCAHRWRAAGLLLVFFLIAFQPFFTPGATVPLTDLPRSCFSVAAVLYLWRYLETFRPSEIVSCALVLGGAVGGKYTELQMVGLIGLALLPSIYRGKLSFSLFLTCLAAFLSLAGYWYAKNLILLGNPIYPFIFGHPGLSDQWMAEYTLDLGRAFDPENRVFVTDLTTRQGWHDFFFIMHDWFLDRRRYAIVALILIIGGLIASFTRIFVLVAMAAAMFVTWYAVMFNHIRWATPAYLLYFSTAYIGASLIVEKVAASRAAQPGGPIFEMAARVRVGQRTINGHLFAFAVVLVAIVIFCLPAVKFIYRPKGQPYSWMEQGVMDVLIGRQKLDDFLGAQREGYIVYRYIAANDLRTVFQPFDTGSTLYAAAYTGGRDMGWLLPPYMFPESEEDVNAFIRRSNIRYFIRVTEKRELLADRIGAAKFKLAEKTISRMLPESTLLLKDGFGSELYRFDGFSPQ
ncbi:hypothetical protein [Rhizobium laguerreae]|uniref:Glycosyltransferase RgtA/B/C/D-like domain-containing protein n=1 Tax=Rhizobium laguerreae TaxID=1076926 RepID=A0AAX2QVI7_9HYPH|nr:hypothetical protein [Rhizobium laguerreae]MBY3123325.1 hypothetical protein [Rhizobium laguerreae]MBY3139199.1 hypothetical protein [Rhizobium laguerreae]MBY3201307.1 hypothetical protein [Rhizobium laguerreae]MBY3260111.1 hypothetical protein [Rhizobium laguerreae]MBY3335370.1 hypothetical protein [Rhizobium laguerreae]